MLNIVVLEFGLSNFTNKRAGRRRRSFIQVVRSKEFFVFFGCLGAFIWATASVYVLFLSFQLLKYLIIADEHFQQNE
jgi:hypothetical protein